LLIETLRVLVIILSHYRKFSCSNKFESGEIPFRQPKSLEEEGQGFGGFLKALTGGGS